MTLANRITFLRVILAPAFFLLYLIPENCPVWAWAHPILIVALLWVIFLIAEITDGLDGMVARRFNQSSDFGRLFDPLADTLVQVTFFLCFVLDGIFPAALFLVVVYREFGILFVRNLMLKKGITMGARMSGKIKTTAYIIACSTAMVYASLTRLYLYTQPIAFLTPIFRVAAVVVFAISVVISVASFFDYVSVYLVAKKEVQGAAE
ncbi:MAG: CDP-diacylglycerol--glycerol-3-phosphate 3-phosphatidyltransferase [Treponema sp.]|nr:CDP-diacylglycerol--glycerol-3-phosphate 3-phosphatidyltransferase [Treponema sp.]